MADLYFAALREGDAPTHMNAVLQRLARLVPSPDRWRSWLVLALLIKTTYFGISLSQGYYVYRGSCIAAGHPDSSSYFEPLDNLVDTGVYQPDYRLPGPGAIYLPLRMVADAALAKDLFIVAQLLLDVLAVYALAFAAFLLLRSRTAFLICFGFYGLASTISGFNVFLLTESACASALCFTIYFVARYVRGGSARLLVWASFLQAWAYFLRPVLAVYALLFVVFVIVFAWRLGRRPVIAGIAVLLPLSMVQASWSLRNYFVHDRWQLLTTSLWYPSDHQAGAASWELIGTWDRAPEVYFFPDLPWPDRQSAMIDVRTVPFPKTIRTEIVTIDSLVDLREECLRLTAMDKASPEYGKLDRVLAERFHRYARSVRKEHPLLAYVLTPLRLTALHVFTASGVRSLFLAPFDRLPNWAKGVKLFHMMLFLAALYGALLFIPWSLFTAAGRAFMPLSVFLVYGLTVHPVVFRLIDVRYLYVLFPVMCLCATLFYFGVLRWWRARVEQPPN